MSDLISRRELIEEIREVQSNLYFSNIYCDRKTLEGISSGFDKTVSIIEEQPTVEPKRGEWKIKTKNQGGYIVSITCSACGYSHSRVTYNFCPECGADMRKGVDKNV